MSGRSLLLAVALLGAGAMVILYGVLLARRAAARAAYDKAPPCPPGNPSPGCRDTVDAELVDRRVERHGRAVSRELHLRLAGGARKIVLVDSDLYASVADGQALRVEVFGHAVTAIEVDGRMVPTTSAAARAAGTVVLVAGLALVAAGAIWLLLRRRRR